MYGIADHHACSNTHLATSSTPRISRPTKKAGSSTQKLLADAPPVKFSVRSSCSKGGSVKAELGQGNEAT